MKRIIVCIMGIAFISGMFVLPAQPAEETGDLEGSIAISGAWALYPMVVAWVEEFKKVYPKVTIDVSAGGAGKGMTDCLSKVVDIGMVSREVYPQEVEKGAWFVAVTKDAVVPTVNERNPVIDELLKRGLKKEEFAGIWGSEAPLTDWGVAVGRDKAGAIHVYTRSDACGAGETWAKYLGTKQEDLLGVGVYGDPGLAEAVKNDVLGIGYNNINYVYDGTTKEQVSGIRILPIDINGDGRVSDDERFYDNRDAIVQAIADGRYPSPPARDLYFVSCGRPESEVARRFIRWVLTDGQRYVSEYGYINLTSEKLEEGLQKLE